MPSKSVRSLTFVRIAVDLVRIVNTRTDHIAAFAKGLSVIACFGADRARLSIAQVAAITRLDRATARRCLLTLHHEGYADYDGKFFKLTPRVLRLGLGALAAMPLAQIVQPWLDQLSEQVGQSSSVSILDETEIVYLARAAQRRVMSIGLMPGSRLPCHCTSMGRVLLAALPEAQARALLDRCELTPRTVYSLTDPDAIMAALRLVRTQGHCIIDQEVELGLRSIAVPVMNVRGQVVAALNIGAAAVQAEPADLVRLYLPQMLTVQAGLRRVLG